MVTIPVAKLDGLFAAIAAREALYLPVDDAGGQASYQRWKAGTTLSRQLNTVRSAKDFFFPQTENIVDFRMQGKNIEVIDTRTEAEDFVIFGVRGCDVASFAILDKVFLAKPVDTFYRSRREHGVIVSLACTRPDATCFCPLFGVDAASPDGDVTSWIEGDSLYLQANTDRGRALLDGVKDLVTETSADAVAAQKKRTAAVLAKLPFAGLKMDTFRGENLNELFGSPEWAKLSEACLGCGTCTFVCPTCQCYDIRDFDTGHGIRRFRCWDSCMYSEFTKMAAANPRLTQLERFRQRFMHKLVYYPSNNGGTYACVGCGRCLRKCPQSMNIVKVMKALGEEQ